MVKATLSSSEDYLWTYIQQHIDDIANMSIIKLSEQANVSTATIVRTMKKKGYNGFTSFKQQLIQKNKDNTQFAFLNQVDQEIKAAVLKNQHEVNNTLENLDIGIVEDSIQKIKDAHKVYIFARGFSEFIAKEMTLKLQLLGKNCEIHDDPNIIKPISKQIMNHDVLILITLNGETAELVQAAKNAMQNNVTIITFTTNPNGTILQFSDLVFLGYKSPISYFPDYEVHSRLPLNILVRILLDAYAIRSPHLLS